jgi:hypothetical protein
MGVDCNELGGENGSGQRNVRVGVAKFLLMKVTTQIHDNLVPNA